MSSQTHPRDNADFQAMKSAINVLEPVIRYSDGKPRLSFASGDTDVSENPTDRLVIWAAIIDLLDALLLADM
jgi:hypothetical protein